MAETTKDSTTIDKTTKDLTTINKWLGVILSSDKLAIATATEIAAWVFSIGASYPQIEIKAFRMPKDLNKKIVDVRFCFDRGNDCKGEKINTAFFIIRKNDLQVIVSPYTLNKYHPKYLTQDNVFYGIKRHDAENLWKKNDSKENLKEIIYHALKERAKTSKPPLDIEIPSEYLVNKSITLNEEKKGDIPSDAEIQDVCQRNGSEVVNPDEIRDEIEQQAQKNGRYLHPDWFCIKFPGK